MSSSARKKARKVRGPGKARKTDPMWLALDRAIEAAGGQTRMAEKCNTTQSTVWGWLNEIGKAPAERVIEIERACDGRVPRHQLRPDIFDAPPFRAEAAQ